MVLYKLLNILNILHQKQERASLHGHNVVSQASVNAEDTSLARLTNHKGKLTAGETDLCSFTANLKSF